jgi:superfamily II DNA/RNA helicase
MSKEVRDLTAGIMRDPVVVEVGAERKPAETVRQHFYLVQKERKIDLLFHLLGRRELDSVLVFSRTKHGADKIHRKLSRSGISSAALHSNRSQVQRQKALDEFKRGRVRVLVATDIAARGIDVTGISHVINYDTPGMAEDYIHRIGRTGRAAAEGDAITFVSNAEFPALRKIENFVGRRYTLMQEDGVPAHVEPETTGSPRDSRQGGNGRQGRNGRQEGNGRQRSRSDNNPRGHSSGRRESSERREPTERRESTERREPTERRESTERARPSGRGKSAGSSKSAGSGKSATGRTPSTEASFQHSEKRNEGGMQPPKRRNDESHGQPKGRRDSALSSDWYAQSEPVKHGRNGQRDRKNGEGKEQSSAARKTRNPRRPRTDDSIPEWAQKKRKSAAPLRFGPKR